MRFVRTLVLASLLAFTPLAPADSSKGATAEIAVERLTRIDQLLQQYVSDSRIPGAVVLVLHNDKPVYEKAVGWSDKEAGRHMEVGSLFRIASQTKALTSVVALSLIEEGKLVLSDPVSKFIP